MSNALDHIPAGHLDESVFTTHCVSLELGPLKLEACVNTLPPSADVSASLLGQTIGRCTLDLSHPECTIGGSVDGIKAEVKLALEDSCITYLAIIVTPFKDYKYEGNLYCW